MHLSSTPDSPLDPHFHNLLHKYIVKSGWNSIFGLHFQGLTDGVNAARGRVQKLLAAELPPLRMALEPTLPSESKDALLRILGDLEQAAWSLAKELDGKGKDELIADRKLKCGPWVELMHTMDLLERRAIFYMIAIEEQKRARKQTISENGTQHLIGSSKDEPSIVEGVASTRIYRPSAWFDRATRESLYPDLLKRAVHDKRLRNSKKRSQRWMHDVEEVIDLYPEYLVTLRWALKDDAHT